TIAPRASGDPAADAVLLPVEGSLESTAAAVTAYGVDCLQVSLDLSDPDSVRDAARVLHDAWGALDLVVNNAFVHRPQQAFLDLTADSLRASWEGNFLHQVLLVQLLLGPMLARGSGTVVDMASSSATYDPPAGPGDGGWGLGYASSKAAFGRMAGSINAELGSRGIRAFNVDPGFVVTESALARGGTEAIADEGGYPSADPGASGAVIAWLATSPDADRFLGKIIWAPKLAEDLAARAT
ncbi:MAG: SDR family NAD(P)-dependent oxidoreductase, partial [Marmoricola sp.]